MKPLPSSRRRQRGLSLVEMMVSIALGLLILVAILQVFTASRQTYRYQQNISRMQENARIAIEILQRTVRDTGFEPPPASSAQLVCATAAACLLGGSNNLTSSQATAAAAISGSDTLIIRIRSDGNATDCQGETLPYNLIAGNDYVNALGNPVHTSNEFRIGPTVPTTTNPPSLRCGQSSSTSTSWGQPLVDDIEDMQVLYGYRNSSTGNLVYVPGNLLATSDYYLITAVRIQLCVRSPDANVVSSANTQHCLMDSDGDGANDDDRTLSTTDGRLRQVVTTTIKLRNRP